MPLNRLKKLLIACLFFYMPFQANAWGVLGHRIIAQIADTYLTAKARKQIMEILGTETMALTSNWADFIKSDSTYNYLYNWHFINLQDGFTQETLDTYLKNDTATDAYTKLNFLVVELKNKQLAPDKKLLYLRLLIHIAGDLHQPMHVAHAEDLGANKIRVQWFNTPANLHAIWDEKLIDFQQLSYTEYTAAINHTTKQQRVAWQQQPISEWIFESYQISRAVYTEITQPEQKLGYRYNFDHIQTVNSQLLKGGVRLAGLLNEIFGS